jgi:hypothetical protein
VTAGWLCYNAHGLDDEGCGPLSATTLERLLARLVERDDARVLPVGAALDLVLDADGWRRARSVAALGGDR